MWYTTCVRSLSAWCSRIPPISVNDASADTTKVSDGSKCSKTNGLNISFFFFLSDKRCVFSQILQRILTGESFERLFQFMYRWLLLLWCLIIPKKLCNALLFFGNGISAAWIYIYRYSNENHWYHLTKHFHFFLVTQFVSLFRYH